MYQTVMSFMLIDPTFRLLDGTDARPVVAEAVNRVVAIIQPDTSKVDKPAPKITPSVQLLVFTAPSWCAPCRRLEGSIAGLPASWKTGTGPDNHIVIIDIDQNPERARRFGIESVPTTVLFANGQEVSRHSGIMSTQAIADLYNSYVRSTTRGDR